MVSKRILVTGNKGQLGTDLMTGLAGAYELSGFDIDEVDICDSRQVLDYIKAGNPEIVIHAAAFTDVDRCETDRETAMAVNAVGTENIAEACREIGAGMIYYSTDYVFDGSKGAAYIETDTPNPMTVYGISKLEGERLVADWLKDSVILRIAWVYGLHGRNFVKTMIKLGQEQIAARRSGLHMPSLKVVNDQIGNPTWTYEIVRQTQVAIENNLSGLFHSTSEGEVSWYHFARAVFEEAEMDVDVVPCTTEEYPRPAPRPRFSALENKNLKDAGLNKMVDYRVALKEFVKQNGAMRKI